MLDPIILIRYIDLTYDGNCVVLGSIFCSGLSHGSVLVLGIWYLHNSFSWQFLKTVGRWSNCGIVPSTDFHWFAHLTCHLHKHDSVCGNERRPSWQQSLTEPRDRRVPLWRRTLRICRQCLQPSLRFGEEAHRFGLRIELSWEVFWTLFELLRLLRLKTAKGGCRML